MKGKFSIILRVCISLGLAGFLLWTMRPRFSEIAATLAKTNLLLFLLVIILFIIDIALILSVRLRLLLAGEGLRIPFASIVQLSYIGYFFNNFMPTAVGGDIVKAYYAYKHTNKKAKAFVAVFMDRFIGLFSFVSIGVIALFLSWKSIDSMLKSIVFAFAGLFAIAFLVMLNGSLAKLILKGLPKLKLWNIGEKLSGIYKAVHEYRNKKSIILMAIGISAAGQCIYFSMIYLLSRSLGTDIPLLTVFLIMPVISVVSMLPSLGGLGLREGAIVLFFGPFIGNDNAFSVSILLLATLLIISMMGAVIYLTASQFRIKGDISKFKKDI